VVTLEPIRGPAATGLDSPLDGSLLAMDVADTLRRRPELLEGEDPVAALRELYEALGIAADERRLADGIAAYRENRFAYAAPEGLPAKLARIYVSRRKWAPPALALALSLVIGLGGYFFAWRPFHEAQVAAEKEQLSQTMPARMDQLYQTIFTETKVQQPVNQANQIITRGKAAAAAGDRPGAQQAIDRLTAIRDQLREEYTLRIVNREGEKSAFWTFPKVNTAATNYYVVVEAIDAQGTALSLPVTDEVTGKTDKVTTWALRVPESVYRAVESDRLDDGVLERGVLGIKEFGFLDVQYAMPVIGGAVTRW
jgi:hypothetical protein